MLFLEKIINKANVSYCMGKGAIQLGIETIIIIGLALIILMIIIAFFYSQFVGPAGELGNVSSGLNITLPNII